MKHIITLIIIFSSLISFSQSVYVGASLNSLLKKSEFNEEFYQVDIVLNGKVDLFQLNKTFKQEGKALAQRQKIVLRKLINASEETQLPFLNDLSEDYEGLYKDENRLWIVNMITLKATPKLLNELVKRSDIEFIDLSSARMTKPVDFIRGEEIADVRSINGSEPGLVAINAPALWAMGYTGRGRIGYSIDTGVWPDHPAISENWLGNHVPLDHAWYWYDTQFPGDKGNAHGTHTIGTTMGLDRNNNDTIGVAFNSKFIASDPVATNINTVIPLAEFMPAFQYALNPDGDTSTVSDIPDAINNSWGFTIAEDTLLCESYVTDMFLALEAAGIANVASAGNDGPNNNTMTYPFHVNPGLVNSFTVGAINGNNPAFPIASFSSRGPTICPGDSSFKIKPEVVAPGVNVRSAIEDGGYANYQGTSMAGPHATGAVLLLKEAFPYLAGEEILLALYHSAVDLGPVGEDNSYGNGMIDVLAAFNYLSLSHTPVAPDTSYWDISISEITNPNSGLTCEGSFTPQIIIENKGDSMISSLTVYYGLIGGQEFSQPWTGNLSSGQGDVVTLGNISVSESANYEFYVRLQTPGNIQEVDTLNNSLITRFNYRGLEALPFLEQFEQSDLYSSIWYVENEERNFTWDTVRTIGNDAGRYSAVMSFSNLYPNNEIDALISPRIDMPASGDVKLQFDYSYQYWHQIFTDTLSIWVSDDCGETWSSRLFYQGGQELNTVNDTNPGRGFIPSLPDHWNDTIIDISQLAGAGGLLFKFEGKNKRGNNLILDNIKIYSGQEPMGVEEEGPTSINVFPNPTAGSFSIDLAHLKNPWQLSIHSLDGQLLKQQQLKKQNQLTLDIEGAAGVYFLSVFHDKGSSTVKLIKQ